MSDEDRLAEVEKRLSDENAVRDYLRPGAALVELRDLCRALLSEVRELREENERLLKDNDWQHNQLETATLHTRIAQMEEALREAAETFQAEGLSTSAEMCRKALG